MKISNKERADSPGVVIPPPLFYLITFLFSIFLQTLFSINHFIFHSLTLQITAITLIVMASAFMIPALQKFIKSKNTVVTVKPASSLQTSGIYSVSRNPMYLGLFLLYTGLAILAGNWWTIIFIPILVIIITRFIIIPEEHYLLRKFGDNYSLYKTKVRRFI